MFLAACSQEPEWVPGQTVLYVVVYNPLEVPAQVSTRCSLQPAPRNLGSVPGQTVLYVVVYNPLEVPTQVSTSQRLKVSKGHSKNKTKFRAKFLVGTKTCVGTSFMK